MGKKELGLFLTTKLKVGRKNRRNTGRNSMTRKKEIESMRTTRRRELQITILINSKAKIRGRSMPNILKNSTRGGKPRKCTQGTKTRNSISSM